MRTWATSNHRKTGMATMNEGDAKALGAQHARDGKQCTPFDCREIDAQILAVARQESAQIDDHMERVAVQASVYKGLRGAFNDGWHAEYFATASIA